MVQRMVLMEKEKNVFVTKIWLVRHPTLLIHPLKRISFDSQPCYLKRNNYCGINKCGISFCGSMFEKSIFPFSTQDFEILRFLQIFYKMVLHDFAFRLSKSS